MRPTYRFSPLLALLFMFACADEDEDCADAEDASECEACCCDPGPLGLDQSCAYGWVEGECGC